MAINRKGFLQHLLTAALIATALASPMRAEMNFINTVQDFVQECDPDHPLSGNNIDAMQVGFCLGVVQGLVRVVDMNCTMGEEQTYNRLKADLSGVSFGAMNQAMLNFARANPRIWQESVGFLTIALAETWPCE